MSTFSSHSNLHRQQLLSVSVRDERLHSDCVKNEGFEGIRSPVCEIDEFKARSNCISRTKRRGREDIQTIHVR